MTDFCVASSSVSKGGRKAGSKAIPTMHIGGPTSGLRMPSTLSTPPSSQPPSVLDEPHPSNRAHDPVDMVNSSAGLIFVLSITEDKIEKAIERNKLDPTSIMQTMHELPSMTV